MEVTGEGVEGFSKEEGRFNAGGGGFNIKEVSGVGLNRIVFNLCEETISRTDEGQPRPKYIFNKCGTNIYFFTLQRFGPSPSPNFR